MIYELSTALRARYESDAGATLRGLTQGFNEAVSDSGTALGTQSNTELEKSTLPFINYSFITTELQQTFCSNIYQPLIQFTIFGDADNKSSKPLLQIGQEFLLLYGDTLLSMDNGYTMVKSNTVDQRSFIDSDKMWNIIYSIRYWVEVNK